MTSRPARQADGLRLKPSSAHAGAEPQEPQKPLQQAGEGHRSKGKEGQYNTFKKQSRHTLVELLSPSSPHCLSGPRSTFQVYSPNRKELTPECIAQDGKVRLEALLSCRGSVRGGSEETRFCLTCDGRPAHGDCTLLPRDSCCSDLTNIRMVVIMVEQS